MSSYCVHFFPKKYQLNVKETFFFFFFPVQTFLSHAMCGPKLNSVMAVQYGKEYIDL